MIEKIETTLVDGSINIVEIPLNTKEFTVRQIYKNLAKNGWEHLRETWFGDIDPDTGKPMGACVLGQAALNLNVKATLDETGSLFDFRQYWPEAPFEETSEELENYERISKSLDNWFYRFHGAMECESYKLTLLGALNQFRSTNPKWVVPEESKVGNLIIYWNDKRKLDGYGDTLKDADGDFVYELKTYEEVAQMAKEILEPFFDETMTLLVS